MTSSIGGCSLINFIIGTASDDGIVILVRESRTNQKKFAKEVEIPSGKGLNDCLSQTTALSLRMVTEIVKMYWKKINKRVAIFSSHSLSSGLATSEAIATAFGRSIHR